MQLERLWLHNFRSYENLELELPAGLTAIVANNGIGKTNLVEAAAYLATLKSFRGADSATMIKVGAPSAVVRGEAISRSRKLLIEAELMRRGKSRVQVNRQRLARFSELGSVVQVTVFTPDDLAIVKGSPGLRRDFFDDAVVAMWPRQHETRRNLNQLLRQRNAFLRSVGGKLSSDDAVMLDIWDDRLGAVSEALGAARISLLAELEPLVQDAYWQLSDHKNPLSKNGCADGAGNSGGEAGGGSGNSGGTGVGGKDNRVRIRYEPAWFHTGISEVLKESRVDDVRRQTTLYGPHRDDFIIELNGITSRTYASQGEQRTLALALRLALHRLLTKVHNQTPLLILDDVFSELDPNRSQALFQALPKGQILLTSAVDLPAGIKPDLLLHAQLGSVEKAL